MSIIFLIFVCFIVHGIGAGYKEITEIQRENKFKIELGLNTYLDDYTNKYQHNMKYDDKDDKMDDTLKLEQIKFLSKKNESKLDWWQTGIIYEIYPRSFKDSTDNGVGDLRGVIEKIPYLKYLGVSTIWITPIYPSPGVDFGYDISDYRGIEESMGTMHDFEELTDKLHENGIKIILDIVPNHTSDQHEWFPKSEQRIEPYTDYYLWADAKYLNLTRQFPNNWSNDDGSTMWEWNEIRQQYFFHQFCKQQPDLNFWNPLVREEIQDLLRFWLDKGVDGFRMDAIQHLYERQDLLDSPILESGKIQKIGYTQALDETFYEVNDWRSLLDEYKKKDGQTRILIIETYLRPELTLKYYGNKTSLGAHFPLNLCLTGLNHKSAKEYVEILTEWMSILPSGAWSSWTIGNHDINPRAASRFGLEIIDGMHMIQLLLPGTPIIYMGDELGMTDVYLRDDQVFDINLKKTGHVREKVRTPFQWDSSPQAGFSNKTKTWLPVNPNYVTLNVEFEQNAEQSHLKIFKEIVNLRQLEIFRTGDLKLYEISEYVFAFSRSNKFLKTYFIVINLGSEIENINLKKFKMRLSSKLTVKIASLFAEQKNGDVVCAKSFTMRPSAALVLESSFY